MDLIGDVPIQAKSCFRYCTLICSSVLVPRWPRAKQRNVSSLIWTLLLFQLKISTALSTGVHQGCVLSPLWFTQLTCDMCIHTWKPDHKMCRWHHSGVHYGNDEMKQPEVRCRNRTLVLILSKTKRSTVQCRERTALNYPVSRSLMTPLKKHHEAAPPETGQSTELRLILQFCVSRQFSKRGD